MIQSSFELFNTTLAPTTEVPVKPTSVGSLLTSSVRIYDIPVYVPPADNDGFDDTLTII